MKKFSIICFVVLLAAIFVGCSNSPTPTVSSIPTWLQGTWDYSLSGQSLIKIENGFVVTSNKIYYDFSGWEVYIYDGTNSEYTDTLTLSNPSSTCFKITMKTDSNTYYQFDYKDANTVKMTENDGTAGTSVEYDLTK